MKVMPSPSLFRDSYRRSDSHRTYFLEFLDQRYDQSDRWRNCWDFAPSPIGFLTALRISRRSLPTYGLFRQQNCQRVTALYLNPLEKLVLGLAYRRPCLNQTRTDFSATIDSVFIRKTFLTVSIVSR